MALSFYQLSEIIPVADFGRVNDINGNADLKPITDIGIARREEPSDEELYKLQYGFNPDDRNRVFPPASKLRNK